LRWRPPASPTTVARGDVRVLAIRGDAFAWSDAVGEVVHVTDLATGTTTAIRTNAFALTARFSPDGAHVAILVSQQLDTAVIADTRTGRVVWYSMTSATGRSVAAPDYLPPAYLPVPFTWQPDGRLLVVFHADIERPFIERVDASSGVSEPDDLLPPIGLSQLVSLAT